LQYPVCKLWLSLVNKYNTTQPFSKFSKEYSLDYNKVREYGANTFKAMDYAFIEKLCSILNCSFDDLFIDDKEDYQKKRRNEQNWITKSGVGVVYFVKNHEGLTKIGRTSNLKSRLSSLKQDPRGKELTLIHAIESKDIKVLEKTLHKVFADKRVSGEWFELSDKDLLNITN
jgi:hypothetical protein